MSDIVPVKPDYLATNIVNERALDITKQLERATKQQKKFLWCLENGMPFSLVWSKSLYIVSSGGVALDGKLIAAQIRRRADKYDYDVTEWTNELCTVVIYRYSKRLGEWVSEIPVTFTKDDAIQADLWNRPNWRQYPRNHLFYMAISLAHKVLAGDVFETPVYAVQELPPQMLNAEKAFVEAESVKIIPQKLEPDDILMLIDKYGAETGGKIIKQCNDSGRPWQEVVKELELARSLIEDHGEEAVIEANNGKIPQDKEQLDYVDGILNEEDKNAIPE